MLNAIMDRLLLQVGRSFLNLLYTKFLPARLFLHLAAELQTVSNFLLAHRDAEARGLSSPTIRQLFEAFSFRPPMILRHFAILKLFVNSEHVADRKSGAFRVVPHARTSVGMPIPVCLCLCKYDHRQSRQENAKLHVGFYKSFFFHRNSARVPC